MQYLHKNSLVANVRNRWHLLLPEQPGIITLPSVDFFNVQNHSNPLCLMVLIKVMTKQCQDSAISAVIQCWFWGRGVCCPVLHSLNCSWSKENHLLGREQLTVFSLYRWIQKVRIRNNLCVNLPQIQDLGIYIGSSHRVLSWAILQLSISYWCMRNLTVPVFK